MSAIRLKYTKATNQKVVFGKFKGINRQTHKSNQVQHFFLHSARRLPINIYKNKHINKQTQKKYPHIYINS